MEGKSCFIIARTELDLSVTRTRILTPELTRKLINDFREKTSISEEEVTLKKHTIKLTWPWPVDSMIWKCARGSLPDIYTPPSRQLSFLCTIPWRTNLIQFNKMHATTHLDEICAVWGREPRTVKTTVSCQPYSLTRLGLRSAFECLARFARFMFYLYCLDNFGLLSLPVIVGHRINNHLQISVERAGGNHWDLQQFKICLLTSLNVCTGCLTLLPSSFQSSFLTRMSRQSWKCLLHRVWLSLTQQFQS